ncbi:unnamed protein product [Tilletia caries]|nr:unnamed protein product [Tilletia caries]
MILIAPILVLFALAATVVQADAAEYRVAPSIKNSSKRDARNSTLATRRVHPGPFKGGHGTWYNVERNEVDCGGFYKHTDFVVALNQVQYGDLDSRSPYCDKQIRVTANGKTTIAKVVDACPTSANACHYGSLDMSIGLFKHFDDLNTGVIDIVWKLIDADGNDEGESHEQHVNHDDHKSHRLKTPKVYTPRNPMAPPVVVPDAAPEKGEREGQHCDHADLTNHLQSLVNHAKPHRR